MNEAIALYACRVMHRRHGQGAYLFRYRLFSLLLDIDQLQRADAASRWFSIDRFNLLSFHRSDHLPPGESDLRGWAQRVLAAHGIDGRPLRIRLLCMPRLLGWGFDPLSVWYCERADGTPVAAICEVHNTFGERHCYLLRADGAQWPLRSAHAKQFHVSPFMPVAGDYAFVLERPQQRLRIAIQYAIDGAPVLSAAQLGDYRPFNSRELLRQCMRVPAQTLKVLGAIHWHALKIWLRGVPFFRKPEPPLEEVS